MSIPRHLMHTAVATEEGKDIAEPLSDKDHKNLLNWSHQTIEQCDVFAAWIAQSSSAEELLDMLEQYKANMQVVHDTLKANEKCSPDMINAAVQAAVEARSAQMDAEGIKDGDIITH